MYGTNRVATQSSPFNCVWIPRDSIGTLAGSTYAGVPGCQISRVPSTKRIVSGVRSGRTRSTPRTHARDATTRRPFACISARASAFTVQIVAALMTSAAGPMTRKVFVVPPDLALSAAWDLMSRKHFRHLPVVSGQALIGMLSDRDILRGPPWSREPFAFQTCRSLRRRPRGHTFVPQAPTFATSCT